VPADFVRCTPCARGSGRLPEGRPADVTIVAAVDAEYVDVTRAPHQAGAPSARGGGPPLRRAGIGYRPAVGADGRRTVRSSRRKRPRSPGRRTVPGGSDVRVDRRRVFDAEPERSVYPRPQGRHGGPHRSGRCLSASDQLGATVRPAGGADPGDLGTDPARSSHHGHWAGASDPRRPAVLVRPTAPCTGPVACAAPLRRLLLSCGLTVCGECVRRCGPRSSAHGRTGGARSTCATPHGRGCVGIRDDRLEPSSWTPSWHCVPTPATRQALADAGRHPPGVGAALRGRVAGITR